MSTNSKATPHLRTETVSKIRLQELADAVVRHGGNIPEGFDIDEIHWVKTENHSIGITDLEGSYVAKDQGHVVINTAGELEDDSPADFHFDIHPDSWNINDELDKVVECIHNNIDKGVVVHCAMGMERSPLSVVWYLKTHDGASIDQAYDLVRQARPIAMDRRSWLGT